MYEYNNFYSVAVFDDEIYHHGVKGMKWGVRRYQNADGSLTSAGKKRQARIEKSDARYREKQMVKTAKYYDKNRRTGTMGMKKVEGINSLQKKLDSQSGRYDKNVIKGQLAVRQALKQNELKKVSQLTHEQIQNERRAVGKARVKDILISAGTTALLAPTTGFAYYQVTDAQTVRSQTRRSS
jgi:hypothetical protein